MDKRNKRNDATDKKTDKVRDRGDLKKDKMIKKNDENTQVDMTLTYPERGDSDRKTTNQKPEKMRINIVVKKPTNEDARLKTDNTEKEVASKKNSHEDKAQCELELRKRIRDKYTLKLRSPAVKNVVSNSNLNKKDDGIKVPTAKNDGNKNADRPKKLPEDSTQVKEKLIQAPTAPCAIDIGQEKKPERNPTKTDRIKSERNTERRKPMIKTIMSKNGPVRIYKAVTFVDQRRSPTPLEINIPGDAMKKQKVSKFTDTSSLKLRTKAIVSRVSIKEKPIAVRKKIDRKREKKCRHIPSPDCSVRGNRSPPTEVARWAPSCIDHHTKPYYEAWVNTTLAAISKSSKKEKMFYKKQREAILQSFQRALEGRPRTPELFYENFADERYTGRIKITQK